MKNSKTKKTIGLVVDILMYNVMLTQMLYVITGNAVHEWMGIIFFLLLICHIAIKRKWFYLILHRKGKLLSARRFADGVILLLFLSLIILSLSSMGVSRLLFPNITFLASPTFHSTLATLSLTLAVIHGGMHGYMVAKKKKLAAFIIILLSAISLGIGFGLVPYLNRHYRSVEIHDLESLSVESLKWKSATPLIV